MTSSVPSRHYRAARDDRAAGRDDEATARDERAGSRDDAAGVRDSAATGRDAEFLDRARRLRERLTTADFRQRRTVDDRAAEGQAEIDQETRRSEREFDEADVRAVRAELDWLRDTYLRQTKRDRVDAADDRAGSRADRAAADQDRTAADADRQQSAVDDAERH
jgi:hypothetical protein